MNQLWFMVDITIVHGCFMMLSWGLYSNYSKPTYVLLFN